jgi:Protein of unknown function (DUF2924)
LETTVLVRDYQGQCHTVTVAADGFNWQGTTYTSLTAIARATTGTAWVVANVPTQCLPGG